MRRVYSISKFVSLCGKIISLITFFKFSFVTDKKQPKTRTRTRMAVIAVKT